jgi:phytoene dehydrogenase-like protein
MNQHFEAVVIGGGVSGLITSLILTESGVRLLLLEKEHRLGGTNSSFKNRLGDVFDYGYHTLDYNRSPFTTRFFERILKGRFHSFILQRGIAVRGRAFPYNAPIEEWPEDIARHIERSEFVDALAGLPTRKAICEIYGDYLARLAFDEILPSYPVLRWLKQQGKPESKLMDQIYPWFFPRAVKAYAGETESIRFHHSVRMKGEHPVMYPDQGGFGAFIDGIIERPDRSMIEIRTGLEKLDVDLDPDTQRITAIRLDGDTVTADRYFWCAPLSIMARLIGSPFPSAHPQRLCLGSFAVDRELPFRFHEILVGDCGVPINRISLPGKIAGGRNNLIQVEYSYPVGDVEITGESWKARCLDYFRQIELMQPDAQVTDFDFLNVNKGFVPMSDPSQLVEGFKGALRTTTNVVYPYIGLEVDNVSRIVPSVFREVYRAITE